MAESKQWAILVPLLEDDHWLYLTEGDSKFNLKVKTFDTASEAYEFAQPWEIYKIVEYKNE